MKIYVRMLVVITALFGASAAMAAGPYTGLYAGVGYHMGSYDESGIPTLNPSGLKFEVGKYFMPNVAVEGQLLVGTGSDNYFGVDLKLKNILSIFVRGDLALSPTIRGYGLLGVSSGEFEASGFGLSASTTDSSLSYGIGAEFDLGNSFSITGEYVSYISASAYDYSGINVGVVKRF